MWISVTDVLKSTLFNVTVLKGQMWKHYSSVVMLMCTLYAICFLKISSAIYL